MVKNLAIGWQSDPCHCPEKCTHIFSKIFFSKIILSLENDQKSFVEHTITMKSHENHSESKTSLKQYFIVGVTLFYRENKWSYLVLPQKMTNAV